ncbi:MAG TPA: D-alanyl-D-alanine carboxypeptidase [Microthrixaceae bacterium]|nr:D-alanyl-D-alanine carboxypeptidase [Microthrixaceae bacterium]
MTTQPPFDGTAEAEPVRGEPPVLSHDPASIAGRDTSVRVIGADVAPGTTGRVTAIPANTPAGGEPPASSEAGVGNAPAGDAPPGATQGPVGPVPGLTPGLTAPVLPDAPKVRKRRRRGWFTAAGVLALVGAGCCAFAVASDGGTPPSKGEPPTSHLVTPLLSARRSPELLARPVAARAAKAAVDPVIARFPAASCVLVTDGTTQLAASGADTPLAPASNTKLLTATAALDVLGADTKLATRVVSATPPTGATVNGDLFLVGGGDPLLSTATSTALTAHGKEPTSSMEALADQVVAAGIRNVTGSVVGDGSRYDDVRTAPKWPQRYITDGTASNLGALMVNDARTIDPIKPGGTGAPAPDPALHAATVFTALLNARGVTVAGAPKAGVAPKGATEITTLPSLTIAELTDQMLTFSDNTTAEMLIKELAAHDGSVGSTAGGIQVLVGSLTAMGLPVEGLQLYDGSGLTRDNRATCALLDAVIQRNGADGPIAKGLARPGQPGTLDDRLLAEPLRSAVAAKTGTLNDVTALSGWLRTTSGRPLAFSTLQNPSGRPIQASDLALQGQLLQALMSYPQSPPVTSLAPLPPSQA